MDQKSFLKKAGFGSVGLLGASPLARSMKMLAGRERNSERPNIIVIMADNMGFSDIGCYGGLRISYADARIG